MKNKQIHFNLIEIVLALGAFAILFLLTVITISSVKQKKLLRTYLSDIQLEQQEYFVKKGNFFISKNKQIVENICLGRQQRRNRIFKESGYEILATLNNKQQVLLNDNTCENKKIITDVVISKQFNTMTNNLNNSEKNPENIWNSTDKL